MNDREKMIELIQEAASCRERKCAAMIADKLMDAGVGFAAARTPIENIDLSTRTYLTLKRNGIHSVEELRSYSDKALKGLRGVGSAVFKELRGIRNGGDEDGKDTAAVR